MIKRKLKNILIILIDDTETYHYTPNSNAPNLIFLINKGNTPNSNAPNLIFLINKGNNSSIYVQVLTDYKVLFS